MTSKSPVRWMMTLGIGLGLLVGAAAAQEAPKPNKGQQQNAGASKQEQPAPAPAKVEPSTPATKADSKEAVPDSNQPGDPVIRSRKDKLSYAFGVDMARDLENQKNGLNLDLLLRALTDRLAGKKLIMSDEEATTTVKAFDAEQKQDLQHARMMIIERNRREGEAFFAENAKKAGVITLPSGLQYKILQEGKGVKPTLDDRVVCQFRSTLLDGTEFDSSEKRGHALTLPVKGLIKGWSQALQLMPVGSKWQLYVPPQLAYGERGFPPSVGPNAMLIFDLEVMSIEKPEAAEVDTGTTPKAGATANPNPAKVEKGPEK